MSNANKTYDLKVEKIIPKSTTEVFRALSEGRLFLNCSADQESLQIDFKVGGKYSIEFISYNMKNCGEFLEIIPNRKITFTWCQDYDSHPTPDTTVSIELKDLGGKTALTLTHTGFNDLENKDAHEGGWSSGLEDLSQEITRGKLRLSRRFKLPLERLFELCKSPTTLFGTNAQAGQVEFLENVTNQKMVFNMLKSPSGSDLSHPTPVTLLFEADDDPTLSWVELVHDKLETESVQKSFRAHWDLQLKRLKSLH